MKEGYDKLLFICCVLNAKCVGVCDCSITINLFYCVIALLLHQNGSIFEHQR